MAKYKFRTRDLFSWTIVVGLFSMIGIYLPQWQITVVNDCEHPIDMCEVRSGSYVRNVGAISRKSSKTIWIPSPAREGVVRVTANLEGGKVVQDELYIFNSVVGGRLEVNIGPDTPKIFSMDELDTILEQFRVEESKP